MSRRWKISLLLCAGITTPVQAVKADSIQGRTAIAVHGGAGTLTRDTLTRELGAAYRAKMQEALETGHRLLASGGSSLDAVEAAIVVMENSPLFNAGVGAVMTCARTHELDASIMSGQDLRAGAVAGVKTVANPIRLARAVMERSAHVMLGGTGAESFARALGIPSVSNDRFTTERRTRALDNAGCDQPGLTTTDTSPVYKWGTVGAVALDRHGNLAAGTSTGGMTAKRWGRIGDSPIIGAGTYADNRACAVSATGHGEYFIRLNVAADICARVRYLDLDIEAAGKQVVVDELTAAGGTGGVIIMSPNGQIAMPFNTNGMYRGSIDVAGKTRLAIFKD